MHRTRHTVLCALGLLAAPGLSFAVDRPESQQEYWAQFDRRDWTAATEAARKLVEAARADANGRPLELAGALSMLGNAQLGSGDYVSAENSFKEGLALVEQHGGTMGPDLLDPLRGLGYTYAASGRHDEAVPALERALRVSHRNRGLFDIDQQGLLRQLAASLTQLGRGSEAERHMNYLQRVAERTFGADDPKVVPLLCVVAEWYSQTGRFPTARDTYRRAIDIVYDKLGKSHVAAVEPLRGLAESYTRELYYSSLGLRLARERGPTDADGASNEQQPINPRYLSSEGERALDHALKILEAQPTPPIDMYVETLIQAGDWRQIKHQPHRAMPLYRRAASLLATPAYAAFKNAEAAKTVAQADAPPALLSFPARVYYPTPWLATRNLSLPSEDVVESFVEVEFNVTNTGEVKDAHVVDDNGSHRQASETLEAIRAARYRPRFIDGEPVETAGVRHREVFKTRKPTPEDSKS